MSENKRVTLNTLESPKVSDKVNKKYGKTIRISVNLPESNEDKCPEFNYKDELAAAKKRLKLNKDTNPVENGLDPFGEDDSDVRRIALEMEAKYGSGVNGPKKKRKGKKDDYADIGMGYDENDSFIDNTDGYDEIIPQNVTTLHGGFYINCGALEFKTDEEASSQVSSSSSDSSSSDSESNKEDEQPKNKKKRVLETSDESGSDTAKKDAPGGKKQKMIPAKNSLQHAIQKKLFSQEKIKVKKRQILPDPHKKIKDLVREKREDLNMSLPVPVQSNEDNLEKDSLKENKKPMSITSVTDAIESVVKQVVEESYDNNQNRQNINVNKMESNSSKTNVDVGAENDSSQDATSSEKKELVQLPENIPSYIVDIINKLKQAAIEYKGEGKKRFFTSEVNSNLLGLEMKMRRTLGKSTRLKIYDHLAYYIKVRKETLIRRARNLQYEEEENRVNQMKRQLKDIIDYAMPSLISNFEQETQKIMQLKFSKEGEDNKSIRLPKRKFQWNDEAKNLLRDIVASKKKCFVIEGKPKDNMEEIVTNFLTKEIVPLWPEGWMSINPLKKAYNSVSENKSSTAPKSFNSINEDSTTIITDVNSTPVTIAKSKHSNLTITPVIPKPTPLTKTEMSNSVTVTKITTIEDSVSNKKVTDTTNASSKQVEVTMSNPQMLKMMMDEIGKNERKNLTPPATVVSNHKEEKQHMTEKGHSPKKIELPKPKSNELFKPYSDKHLSKVEPTKPWPSELFITPAEQAAPKDYSKHRHTDGKVDYLKSLRKDEKLETKIVKSDNFNPTCSLSDAVKHSWHQDLLQTTSKHKSPNEHSEVISKHMRHSELSSMKHSTSSKTHTKHNDVPKASTVVSDFKHISDLLKLSSEPSKHKSKEGNMKLPSDSSVIVVNSHQKDVPPKESDLSSVIPKSTHCQVFDFSEARNKTKLEESRSFKYPSSDIKNNPDIFAEEAKTPIFYPDFMTSPSFIPTSAPLQMSKSEGDDIQKVMENLRALQKLSCSPVKNDPSTSSPVSVIAYNKTFTASKPTQSPNKNDFATLQEDFQKQFINSLQQMTASPPASKSNYKCS